VDADVPRALATNDPNDAALIATTRLPARPSSQGGIQVTLSDGTILTFLKTVITIGRDSRNDVVIQDPQVSRHHAELHVGFQAVSIVDLKSTNGTWVDGQNVKSAVIVNDTQVRIGSMTLSIRALCD
jgi:S-DNA-T family DNA segregation ATPase FtsK/SpoIIIE